MIMVVITKGNEITMFTWIHTSIPKHVLLYFSAERMSAHSGERKSRA